MYLNSVFFGNSAWGSAAASRIYFHKQTKDLDLAEASMLAGLVRGPTVYNPLLNWKSAKARQLVVLNAMQRLGFFFQAEDGIRYYKVTGVQTCALPISLTTSSPSSMPTRNSHRARTKRQSLKRSFKTASRAACCSSATPMRGRRVRRIRSPI